MLENFDYGQVPAQFAHCFRAECRRSGECLRYQIGTCVPKERQSVLVVICFVVPASKKNRRSMRTPIPTNGNNPVGADVDFACRERKSFMPKKL